MTAQLALGYSPSYVGGEVWRQRLEILRLAVNHLGLKEVAFVLDVSGSTLSDATNERDRKRWAAEWLDTAKAMLLGRPGDEIAADIYRQLCELDLAGGPYALVEAQQISPEQEAAELRRALFALGEKGRTAAGKVPRGVRR